jgi:hypothetical protein
MNTILENAFRELVRKHAMTGTLDEFEEQILDLLRQRRIDDAIAQRANCPGIPHEICMRIYGDPDMSTGICMPEKRNIVIGADSLTKETVYDTEDKL